MTINGKDFELNELIDNSINSLLKHFKLNADRIAIEINHKIVTKSNYDQVKLKSDDVVEIIHFVGGGN